MKIAKTLQIFSLIMLSVFTGAFLLIAAVIVPFWQSSEPNYLINWFTENFFRFPTLMVPLNLIAFLATVIALVCSWKMETTTRTVWGIAVLWIILSSITYPIYFASANNLFLERTIQFAEVSQELVTWSSWHWLRTGFAFLAVIFAAVGVYRVK
ncbi:MAG: hypothetical protein ACRC8K_11325 [Waterburya sp.]